MKDNVILNKTMCKQNGAQIGYWFPLKKSYRKFVFPFFILTTSNILIIGSILFRAHSRDDFDSSADEEIEFLKSNEEDAEDEVYTKN